MTNLFHTLISTPFYNGLIFLMESLPFFDAGIIIIIFTIIIKLILLPLSIKSSKAQLQMKSSEKDLKVIKEKYKDKTEQSQKIMEYYKEHNINPFSGIFILIIQIPILIGLYGVFLKSGLPNINTAILYPFIGIPESINMTFLHFVNISEKSYLLAYIAGATAYLQFAAMNGDKAPQSDGSTQSEMMRAMNINMKFFFPVLIAFIAYTVSSAVALYLITSNIFAIFQEYYIKKKYHKSIVVIG
ncbi:MAG: membrane protein insertase YidC [Minisyncoccia bacterium]